LSVQQCQAGRGE
jgi:hypothetical protein